MDRVCLDEAFPVLACCAGVEVDHVGDVALDPVKVCFVELAGALDIEGVFVVLDFVRADRLVLYVAVEYLMQELGFSLTVSILYFIVELVLVVVEHFLLADFDRGVEEVVSQSEVFDRRELDSVALWVRQDHL